MIIDFDNYNTIPNNIIEYILKNKENFYCNMNSNYVNDKYSLFAPKMNILQFEKHMKYFNEQLQDVKILSGHFTRVANVETITSDGLKVLDSNTYINYLKPLVKTLEEKKELRRLHTVICNIGNYYNGTRQGLISFFYPPSNQKSCNHYAKVVGGELIEFMRDDFPFLYSKFCKEGIPLMLVCRIKYDDCTKTSKENLLNCIVIYILQRNLDKSNDNRWMNHELQITRDLSPTDIILVQNLKSNKKY